MDSSQLIEHLIDSHKIDEDVAREVIGGSLGDIAFNAVDEGYLRGFHDGMHGRIDADDLEVTGHGH